MTIMTPAPFALADSAALYGALMAAVADAGDPDSHVFACILSARATDGADPLDDAVGLAPAELDRLLSKHFPALAGRGSSVAVYLAARRGRRQGRGVADLVLAEEMDDLRTLLLDHVTAPADEAVWLASMVARACLFSNHLWQDLGLTGRKDLSGLLLRHFGPLAEKNTGDMKWKKFFYKQLCDREGLNLCKAPSCGVCTDFKLCFGPEE
ncbi:nitrogen fixation protein NifQ [Skermanella pratensis]|uniref:nitrogen fixation protein NifQ n=1 Tax=Skermanella pratensis TaxID=2233999 RepID=UPI001FE4545D|nr:nitrogen fixation protein NifQ [Skermanella pratensis]